MTLLEPSQPDYRQFTDRLLEIYRAACRVQQDQRFSDEGRKRKVAELDDQIVELCGGIWSADLPPLEGPDDDLRLLCNELMRLMLDRQLFVFVTAADITFPDGTTQPVGGTNNEAERTLRGPAEARKTGRTNKTSRGARRQTILVSVLESLRLHLPEFTLPNLIEEIRKWGRTGKSCFTRHACENENQTAVGFTTRYPIASSGWIKSGKASIVRRSGRRPEIDSIRA